ncbi:MAG: hypothetical protein DRQ78_05010 [Epsilonproteobacteria bacterium]|nr:MAG: hypothetical protein DRQ78_05010 [Campylobacterota bacterium]
MATFHSFSGVDMHAVFGDIQFGELQMVSYKSDREKAPVYVMGSSDPRTIARGKRLITGAVVFVVFERDSLLDAMNTQNGDRKPYLSIEEQANFAGNELRDNLNGGSYSAFEGVDGTNTGQLFAAPDTRSNVNALALATQQNARLGDQLLPFDITLVGANEYGKVTKMIINDVELMSEAGGVSIDDLVIEKQMSFIARSISNWNSIDRATGQAYTAPTA